MANPGFAEISYILAPRAVKTAAPVIAPPPRPLLSYISRYMKKGVYILLEGHDRSGKSTQAALLKEWFEGEHGREVLVTREPGGTVVAERVREILLDPASEIAPLTELFLYETSRAQHTIEKILPALKAGKVIISDRYTMSTVAYQGYGRGLDLKTVNALNRIATLGLRPDLTIVFDMPDRIFARRGALRGGRDRMERAPDAFRRRVNRAYRLLARKPGVTRVNAALPIDKVQAVIRARVARLLEK